MKTPLQLATLVFAASLSFPVVQAQPQPGSRNVDSLALLPSPNDQIIHAVAAADNARILASLNADKAGLTAALSDALRYQHSNGSVDTKDAFIEKVVSGRTRYKRLDYVDRGFTVVSDDIVLMHGRVAFHAVSGEREINTTMSFLAVWRLEQGKWRFVAWQSANLNTPPPATPNRADSRPPEPAKSR